ncbi:MAG: Unknown protein [uncultured Campylobacterales bacterium]|uniref:Exodeoxyribonuclease VII small subunit n=1 Tax=uncultured Campylobacterales bacterium TaxID=352960 RepID=A0A6S6SVJ4_9BACT|nr:MAG: Unknown protein [uncultured Campylobacterales bacterium]
MAKDKSSFEENIDKAKEILEKLMDPEISMSEGIKHYKDGLKELQLATKKLEDAKLEYQELNTTDD